MVFFTDECLKLFLAQYFMYLLNEGWQRSKNEFEESRDVREEAVVTSRVRNWLWGDFPGGPVALRPRTHNAGGPVSAPGQGT